ncbi:MAG: 5-formyltetrahydrofolate cyclo-ligase [Ginsengibacter sp.]|jgi:5-formyltetrahydrofolate cyclo-ligase
MTKSELRKIYKEKRKALSIAEINRFNDLILINFQKLPLPFIQCVHTYLASSKLSEVDSDPLVRYLNFINPELMIAIPKIIPGSNSMVHYYWVEETELIMNHLGIEEPVVGEIISPTKIDLILIPLLCFNNQGHRVGYGKGFYDQFLKECREDVIKVGLSFFEAIDQISDVNSLDIAMDYCVTPNQVYQF